MLKCCIFAWLVLLDAMKFHHHDTYCLATQRDLSQCLCTMCVWASQISSNHPCTSFIWTLFVLSYSILKYITSTELTNAACCTECSYITVCIANFIISMVSNIAIDEVRSSTTSVATFWLNVAICCSWWHWTHRMIYSTYNNNVSCDNYTTTYKYWILKEATEIQLHPGNFILRCILQLVIILLKRSIQPVIESLGQEQQPLDSSH